MLTTRVPGLSEPVHGVQFVHDHAIFIGADRGTLWQPSADGQAVSATHSWTAEGVSPAPPTIRTGAFPMFSSLERRGADELYGVANDPASGGGNIGFDFEKSDQPVARGEAIVR